MRRIILSAAMIVFVGAAVVGGTGAFFSDTETSTGNVFAAGALDLRVDSVSHYNGMICFDDGDGNRWLPGSIVEWVPPTDDEDGFYQLIGSPDVEQEIADFNDANPALNPMAGDDCGGTWALSDLVDGPEHTFFNFGDLKPGDTGENTISIHVFNNDSFMCAAIHDVESNDNDCTEPESEDGDETCGDPGVGEGELDQELNFLIWEDDGDNILQEDEENGILYEGLADDGVAGVYPLYTPQTEVLVASTTKYLGVAWCYGSFNDDLTCEGDLVTNLTQTDSLTADITFYVEQARNNDDFTCPDIDEFETPDDPVDPDEEVIDTPGDSWSPEALADTDDKWVAKARYGDNIGDAGAYELEVGFGPGDRAEEDHSYVTGTAQEFSLVYDDTTKEATITVGGESTMYTLTGAGTPISIGITAKGGTDDSTSLTGITLDGEAVADLVAPTTGHVHTSLTGASVEGDFVLEGDLTLFFVSPSDELPALQIDVLY